MTNKMTKKAAFEMLLTIPAVAENSILVDFINHEIELLNKRSASGSGKPSKQAEANKSLRAEILAQMEPGKMYTVTEMRKTLPCCEGMDSPQRLTSQVTALHKSGELTRVVIKRKANFFLTGTVEINEVEG